jgi:pyrroline-5-carboxylate reductase
MKAGTPFPTNSRICFVGGGNMARSLIGGLIRAGSAGKQFDVAEPNAELREALHQEFGVNTHSQGAAAAAQADALVLAVKPQVMRAVCESLCAVAQQRKPLIISIAAGIRIEQIDRWLGGAMPVVRCMPNTPALIGAGASGLFANTQVSATQRALAQQILDAAGLNVWVDNEDLIDTVTGLSGSGPAYFFLLVEALEDAAVAQGLPRAAARTLATQTCLGAGRMLMEDGAAAAVLRQRVTSPNGTTQAALESFEASGLREIVANAVAAATLRGAEMSRQFGD